ncbi:hypothetical protein G6F37_006756 [Rhizopus arrhizus]|nr:hypothetical protein G6F38_007160 [Rhizopus arrhizus]KAG1157373.1 hypothetical protein G6F37_006756 [Rhizopus arrhizus]
MLEFQKQILTEIVSEDGLLIMSPGLGLFEVICNLMQLYTGGNHLVLVINMSQEQEVLVQRHLVEKGVPYEHTLKPIEYSTSAEQRSLFASLMYRQSGLFSITSRILAVDMLLKRIPTSLISGILVLNAHTVKPDSMIQLILRIYREENEEGFIKAFSDRPESFVSGFAPLQNTMKALFLRRVHLWPRFQLVVSENLTTAVNGDVIELRQPMTESMDLIQQSLVECMEATLSELRRMNPQLDVGEFEHAFFKSFDVIVRRQLDPVWHRLSPTSKQLVDDLKTLRQLLGYLTAYDCVTFYSFMETIIAANAPSDARQTRHSQWLFLDAGNRAVSEARKRVYLKKGDPEYDEIDATITDPSLPSHIKLVLEEQPKWQLLNSILEEIEHESVGLNGGEGAAILIMVSERRSCHHLQDYITQQPTLLKQLAVRFFRWRSTIHQIQQQQQQQQQSSRAPVNNVTVRRAPPNKRRRVRGGAVVGSGPGRESGTLADTFGDDVIQVSSTLDGQEDEEGEEEEEEEVSMVEFQMENNDEILPTFEEIPKHSTLTIQCYEDDLHEQILEDTQPRFIIMYDPSPAFVRQVEVYRAKHPTVQIRVYFMLYENSVEEQNYLSLIKKEKESFEKLIHEKSVMAIPLPEKRKEREFEVIRPSTRVAGGQTKVSTGPPVITVDMREFRNVLPPILYARGIKIEPCTLQVGDYILSPEMCVERKSISDLIQSLNSGRLYTQCESMSLYYKIPILLIEFDQSKSFTLQGVSDLRDNIRLQDITSKLVVLTLTFPKLRIIWSSSPHETASIFEDLKKAEEEPNSEKAASIGAEEGESGETIHNMTPQDVLRSMPGINSSNYKLIINKVNNLEELAKMSSREISKIIGEECGQKLYQFLQFNVQLKEQLDIPRVPVSEASKSLIDFCQSTTDLMIPSIWGNKQPDPFVEPVNGCGCAMM